MEDLNMIAADCIILSCCCQCLILQLFIYLLLRIPYKLFKKAMQTLKRIRNNKKGKKANLMMMVDDGIYGCSSESLEGLGFSFRMHREMLLHLDGSHGCCCMEEVDKVLEEFSLKGEFAFGSFWDADRSRRLMTSSCLLAEEKEIDYGVVNGYLRKKFGSFEFQ